MTFDGAMVDPDTPAAPPHDFETERAVLGTLLLHNDALDAVRDVLRVECFTEPETRAIYTAICERADRGEESSPLTMRAWAAEHLQASGGAAYLARLVTESVGVADLGRTAKTLRRHDQRRGLLSLASLATLLARDESAVDIDRTLRGLAVDLDAIAQAGATAGGFVRFDRAVTQAMTMADARYQAGTNLAGLSTGFETLDWRLGGLAPTDLIILAGRPSMGKTALATNIAYRVAAAGHVVGFFSLEMSAALLAMRIVGERAGIPANRLMRGHVNATEIGKALQTGDAVGGLPLYIDQSAALSVGQMAARARQLRRAHGLDLLVVDYLQLIGGSGENRTQEITGITRGLKALAKELNAPLLALSQLSRDVERRTDKRPTLADLRDSGSIEQDADIVAFVFREETYLAKDSTPAGRARLAEVAGQAEIIVDKNRNGPTGTARLLFDAEAMAFRDPAT